MWEKKCIFAAEMATKRLLSTLVVLLGTLAAHGQYLPLAGDTARTALFLDVGRIWNYNLYEHSRWGGGLRLTTHPGQFVFSQIDAEAYLGYGTFDQQWKYGIAIAEHIRGSRLNSVHYQRLERDYFAVGSRHIANPWSEGGHLLGGFMSRHMTENHILTLGHRWHTESWRWAVEVGWGERGLLFDEKQLLYSNTTSLTFESYLRLRLLLRHRCGLGAQVESAIDGSALRLLADYRRNLSFHAFKLNLYAQGGFSPRGNEYVDMFDLGGIYSAPLYLNHGFSTARPNEFTANTFAMLCLRLQTRMPLYNFYNSFFNIGSHPTPFVSLKAVWGNLWGQNADGQRPWLTTYLQAPHKGMLEPSLGLDGVIRFGLADFGVALAYRVTPPSAPYHRSDPRDNLSLLFTAKLVEK